MAECPFRSGDRIRERQHDGQDKIVNHVADEWITTTGVASGRVTTIRRKNWSRYEKLDRTGERT